MPRTRQIQLPFNRITFLVFKTYAQQEIYAIIALATAANVSKNTLFRIDHDAPAVVTS